MENSSDSRLKFEDISQSNISETPRTSLIDSNSEIFGVSRSKSKHISFVSPSKLANTQSFFSQHTGTGSSYLSPQYRRSLVTPPEQNSRDQSLKVLDEKLSRITEELISERNTAKETAWETARDRVMDTQRESKLYISTERSTFAKQISDEYELTDIPSLRWCAYCSKENSTEIEYRNSSKTFWASVGIFLAGGILGCFMLPYTMNSCKDTRLLCHVCKREVAQLDS
ncbi:hypothetical protein SteCoe_30012 [Stentor coeruleus]|uniref:LITAF domain-containing protein n=1 Tax=Stentor coeruleus TaxID=5963 RepID=A0A1R2B4J1_9CILI|nr:hypothetical protein SteCoe_30012 [Stentor coeruleus]